MKPRIGIIGLGHLGKIHLSLLEKDPAFEVAGYFDISKKENVPAKAFDTALKLIEACNALSIVTPTPFHFEYACAAIKAGKHVFIEKPVTSNSIEAKKIAQLAGEAGIVAQAGYVERFNPAFIAAQKFITRPLYIDCERSAVYNPRGTEVSVVHDLMVHDIDLVTSLVRSNIKKISASGSKIVCDSEDVAEARLEFDNGCIANLRVNRAARENKRTMRIFQKENSVLIGLLDKKAFLQNKLSFEPIEVKQINSIAYEFQLFAESIKNKKAAAVSIDEAFATMKIAEEIVETIRK